ncbi:Lrp/AsnC family transcriptional regulator [Candidatus Bathyarchaeota archaeon]|nr:Lrp/AsnC family transcriptional regulator [Candidatus Bathyarchaeota archaeon]
MDKINKKIIEILKKNAREKYVRIAKEVNLTEGAVRQRVNKMISQNIIKRFTVDLGTTIEAIVLIKTDPLKTKSITQQLTTIFDKIFEVSGEYDIAALVEVDDIDKLNYKIDEIRKIKGVIDTNTLIRLFKS